MNTCSSTKFYDKDWCKLWLEFPRGSTRCSDVDVGANSLARSFFVASLKFWVERKISEGVKPRHEKFVFAGRNVVVISNFSLFLLGRSVPQGKNQIRRLQDC